MDKFSRLGGRRASRRALAKAASVQPVSSPVSSPAGTSFTTIQLRENTTLVGTVEHTKYVGSSPGDEGGRLLVKPAAGFEKLLADSHGLKNSGDGSVMRASPPGPEASGPGSRAKGAKLNAEGEVQKEKCKIQRGPANRSATRMRDAPAVIWDFHPGGTQSDYLNRNSQPQSWGPGLGHLSEFRGAEPRCHPRLPCPGINQGPAE